MSQQVTDLTAAVTALQAVVATTIANEQALKQKLDEALAANVTLQQQLTAAQANQADPTDVAAITAATSSLQSQTQALADTAAATAPAN